jgi:hypothetical protein
VGDAAEGLTEEERKQLRKRRRIYAVGILLLIPTIAIVAANRIRHDVPPPLWTEDSLPAPPEADNGWTPIAHYHSTTISGIDTEPIEKLLAVAGRNKAPLGELAGVFRPARVVASKITEHTATCRAAFERKRMMLPCLEVDAKVCNTEPIEICSRLVSFAALDAAARGNPKGATTIAMVLRALTDGAASSRHPWVRARLLILLRNAIHYGATIIKWHRVPAAPVRKALEAITEASLPIEHDVIATYLLKHRALVEALALTDTWLLDEGLIMAGLQQPFEAFRQSGELAAPPDYKADTFWWFVNPVGDKMLDAVKPGADEDYQRTLELRKKLLKRRDEALKLK